jgi:hypothetical protein
MPKETVERTETEVVERTHKESIIICDSCGMDESDRNITRFSSSDYENILYFCQECLSENNTNPIVSNLVPVDGLEILSKQDKIVIFTIAIYAAVAPPLLGFTLNGANGLLSGFFLSILLSALIFAVSIITTN